MHGPAIYRIRVRGRLGESWSGFLSGMRITHTAATGEEADTVQEGRLEDQAALYGVLNSL